MVENLIGFGGEGGSANTIYDVTSGPITLSGGAGRAMANGSTKRGLRLRSVHVGGNGGTRTFTASLAGSSFTRTAASGAPDYQGAVGPLVLVVGGSSHYLTIEPVGSIRLGRGGGGTTVDTNILNVSGTVGGAYAISQAPTAPGLTSVAMASPTQALVTFTAPSDDGDENLVGYRILVANNVDFVGAATFDVDTLALSRLVTVPGPGLWFFKVAARNAVTEAAGSSSVFSAIVSAMISGDVGDLDGWSPYGTLPGGLVPLVGSGLRRGTVYPLGVSAPTGLLREIQCSGSGAVAAAAVGIERTMTGLVIGRTYKLNGTALSLQDTTPAGNLYRFAVTGVGSGGNSTTSDTAHPVAIPEYAFVATATSHVIQIQLNEAASWSTSGWFEAVAFYGVTLTEVPNASPYRLQDVALEASLAAHFTIACDTVGAAWWVDSDDVTQFRQVPSETAVRAIFTDARAPGELEYTDLAESYDTRNVVNDLAVRNHGRDATTGMANDSDYSLGDSASIAEWGVRAGAIEMCLHSGYVIAENLVPNPGAEVNATGYVPAGGLTTLTRSTATAMFGTACLAVTANNNGLSSGPAWTGTKIPVTAGLQYTLSYYAKTTTTRTVQGFIRFYNAADTLLSTVSTVATSMAGGAAFARQSVTATAPAGATYANFYAFAANANTGEVTYWDGFMFTQTPGVVAYYDGDSASTVDLVYGWSGTPHASTSTLTSWELLNERIATIVATLKTPQKVVSSITWNAQENPALAAALDVQDRIRVRFRGASADYRIVGISHKVTGQRWLMTLTLAPS